jgi:hypothetical protein
MTVVEPRRRPSRASRRFGYVVSVLVNAAMLLAVNVWPGWEAVPFLTADTSRVVGVVNATIVVNLVVNVLLLWRDPPWLKALGDAVTTAVGLVAVVRLWQVFPFDLAEGWTTVVRVLLGVAVVGSAIGIVAALVSLVRALGQGRHAAAGHT